MFKILIATLAVTFSMAAYAYDDNPCYVETPNTYQDSETYLTILACSDSYGKWKDALENGNDFVATVYEQKNAKCHADANIIVTAMYNKSHGEACTSLRWGTNPAARCSVARPCKRKAKVDYQPARENS